MSEWQSIKTAPKDGCHFLAWCECEMEEQDDDGHRIGRSIKRYAVVAYFVFGGFVEFPWRGSFVQNLKFTHWQPLPEGPTPHVAATPDHEIA